MLKQMECTLAFVVQPGMVASHGNDGLRFYSDTLYHNKIDPDFM